MDDNYSKNMSLIIDAMFLVNKLTYKAKLAKESQSKEFDRIMRVAGKAWKRFNRRAALVEGIKQVEVE